MSTFKGFKFELPEKKKDQDSENNISNLTFQFSRISAQEDGSRLNSFQAHRSPLASRSLSEAQEERRMKALELQKNQRSITISRARSIALGTEEEEEDEYEDEEEDEEGEEGFSIPSYNHKRSRDSDDEMEDVSKLIKVKHQPNKNNKNKNKKTNIHANQIMYAENLETTPNDFIENWIMMVCPKGKRCLVTSGRGETVLRSRSGKVIGRYQTRLPNGSSSFRASDFCILDCVYDAVHWTFYVLDIMCWRGYSIYDCDTNFRHFWLQTKIDENELDQATNNNRFYKFKAIKPISTSETQIVAQNPEEYIKKQQGFDYDIDGLLFYHCQTNYRGGDTPLVCWVPRNNLDTLL